MSPRTFTQAGIAISLFAALFAAPAFAHHSGAMYDTEQTIEVAATVTGFEWTNPHAWIQSQANDEERETAEWDLELGSPAQLVRQGWRPRIVAPGDDVTNGFASFGRVENSIARNYVRSSTVWRINDATVLDILTTDRTTIRAITTTTAAWGCTVTIRPIRTWA